MGQSNSSSGCGRASRRFVNGLLGLGVLSAATGFIGTALAYLWPAAGSALGSGPLMGRDGVLIPGSLGHDEATVARSHLGKILVIRKEDTFIGLKATCTHLGCTVRWDSASNQVECPCHGARYNLRGEVLRGPARDPLGRVALTAVEDGIHVTEIVEG